MLRPATSLALAVGLACFAAACTEDAPASWRFEPAVAAAPSVTSVRGTVRDRLTGNAITDARVTLGDATTTTDANGAYAFERAMAGETLRVEHALYLSMERLPRGIADVGGDVEMFPSAPSDEAIDVYLRDLQLARVVRDDPNDPALRPAARAYLRGETPRVEPGAREADDDIGVARSALDAPPASIRLWRRSIDGASESCSGRIDVIDLEEYIKGVLPHEWIPSWHDESLRAGGLAIRTYAWNWIVRGGKYDCADLDDTTRSQVYADDRNDRASAAVDVTRGSGISRDGGLVSGEYSAENSDPTADGVSEPLCTGRALAGHGRGMCQWGSQRWALDGRDYTWIATHYWPGSAVEGSSPPVPAYAASLVGMEVPPEMIAGDRATAWVDLRNDGSATWDLGATLLGTTRPNDHEGVFYDADNWVSPNRATAPDHSDYGPGAVGRFSFVIKAPDVASEQVVADTFGLVQEGVTWFGPDDIRVEVLVRPRPPTVVDADGDGVSSDADCDDGNPVIHPGAAEACGDGLDQDCDGADLACGDPPPIGPGDAGTTSPPPPARRDGSVSPPQSTDGPRVAVTPPPMGAGSSGGATEVTGGCSAVAANDDPLGGSRFAAFGLFTVGALAIARRRRARRT